MIMNFDSMLAPRDIVPQFNVAPSEEILKLFTTSSTLGGSCIDLLTPQELDDISRSWEYVDVCRDFTPKHTGIQLIHTSKTL